MVWIRTPEFRKFGTHFEGDALMAWSEARGARPFRLAQAVKALKLERAPASFEALLVANGYREVDGRWRMPAPTPMRDDADAAAFMSWVMTLPITNDPVGDMIGDVKRDTGWPESFEPYGGTFVAYVDYRSREGEDIVGFARELWDRYKGVRPVNARIPLRLRYAVLRRDEFRCKLCGASAATGATLHVDHKRPVAKGGTAEEANLWTLCAECNMGKHTDDLS